jgi:hypothetical protein
MTVRGSDKPYGELGAVLYMKLQELEFEENAWYKAERERRPVDLGEAALDYVTSGYATSFHDRFFNNIDKLTEAYRSGEIERILKDKDKKGLHALIGDA